jgi:hypothetical protein
LRRHHPIKDAEAATLTRGAKRPKKAKRLDILPCEHFLGLQAWLASREASASLDSSNEEPKSFVLLLIVSLPVLVEGKKSL